MSLSLMCYVFDIVVFYKIKNSKYAKLLLNQLAYSYWTQGLWADLYVTNPWEDQNNPLPFNGVAGPLGLKVPSQFPLFPVVSRVGCPRRRYQLEDCSQTVFQTGHCGHCIYSDTLQYWTYLETTFQGRGLRETGNFIDKSTIYTTQIHPQCPNQ